MSDYKDNPSEKRTGYIGDGIERRGAEVVAAGLNLDMTENKVETLG